MTDIKITVDETANGQTVYSQDLDRFLQIYIIDQPAVDAQIKDLTDKIAILQSNLEILNGQTTVRTKVQSPIT